MESTKIFAPVQVPASSATAHRGDLAVFGLLLCAAFAVLVLRDTATRLPHQLADETVYLLESRFFPDLEIVRSVGYLPRPGLVFLRIASFFAHSADYYLLIKVWNAACLAAAAIPAFVVARSVMSVRMAIVASLLVTFAPSTIYGAYFTPESTYILCFWTFMALAVSAFCAPRRYAWAFASGATGAVAFLIKPHALALIGAYAASSAMLCLLAERKSPGSPRSGARDAAPKGFTKRVLLAHLAFFGLGVLLTLLILGRFAGNGWLAALDLKLYSNLLDPSAPARQGIALGSFAWLLALHAAAIVSALAVPLTVFAAFATTNGGSNAGTAALTILASVTLSFLVIMTTKASLDFHVLYGAANTVDRLNLRYYSFAFPLLLFVGIARLPEHADRTHGRLIAKALLVVLAAVACMLAVRSRNFTFVDAPDLSFLTLGNGAIAAMTACAAIAVAVGTTVRKPSLRVLFLACFAAATLLNVTVAARMQQHEERQKTGDQVVGFLLRTFDPSALDHGLIVMNSDSMAAARAAFRLASLSPVVRTVDAARARADTTTKWILVLGDASRTALDRPSVFVGGSTIYLTGTLSEIASRYGTDAPYRFGQSSAVRPGVFPAYEPEAWGTWLSHARATIVFPDPLPRQGRLSIRARVLDPARQGHVTLTLCDRTFPLVVGSGLDVHDVSYACAYRPDRLTLSGMTPVVPRDAGLSDDTRALSLGLTSIGVQ